MSDIVIKAENLCKKYTIGHQTERGKYTTLRDVLMQNTRTIWEKTKDLFAGKPIIQGDMLEEVWALRDVSFDVCRGEVVGIIGRNGAGKSTLLKILSRITDPSAGRVTINGRVSSLLEVGTGFHPELSGRENIYLNGAILGMTRVEIGQKFDEIVAFAEVEKYLDTPVKRYSSGMYVRLAFAVAAHLEPEILIVDEVLAVGDAVFQKKCLGKMEDVAHEGRTVLIVSHQIDMIRALCKRCVLIQSGQIILQGDVLEVANRYCQLGQSDFTNTVLEVVADDCLPIQIIKAKVTNEDGIVQKKFDVSEKVIIHLEYVVRKPLQGSIVKIGIKKNETTLFWSFDTDIGEEKITNRHVGIYKTEVPLPCPLLKPGLYSVSAGVGIANSHAIQDLDNCLHFEVDMISQVSSFLSYAEKRPGLIVAPLLWKTKAV